MLYPKKWGITHMFRTLNPADAVAVGSVAVATVVGFYTDRLPGLLIGLAVVTVQWSMLRRTIYDAYRSGQAACDNRLDDVRRLLEPDAEIKRRH
jgi:hypothetical protein